jgi:hypothetical protein
MGSWIGHKARGDVPPNVGEALAAQMVGGPRLLDVHWFMYRGELNTVPGTKEEPVHPSFSVKSRLLFSLKTRVVGSATAPSQEDDVD